MAQRASWPRVTSPDPVPASAHTAQPPAGAELRPGVLGEEEGKRSPLPLFSPLRLMESICLSCL